VTLEWSRDHVSWCRDYVAVGVHIIVLRILSLFALLHGIVVLCVKVEGRNALGWLVRCQNHPTLVTGL
jgi:hypothetical protein